MKLWLLQPVEPWDPWYDKAFGFVVRAIDDVHARQEVARSGDTGDEDSRDPYYGIPYDVSVWLDESLTTCVELTPEGDAGVVLRDFRAA